MPERLNPSSLPPSAGQSQIVVSGAGRTAYLSGQLPLDIEGNLTGGTDFRAQLQQVIRNIDNALASLGVTREALIRLTIYVVDLDPAQHGSALSELLGDLSSFGRPAATLVSVNGLAREEFLVEIEAIAELD